MKKFKKPVACPMCKKLLTTMEIEKHVVVEWHEAEADTEETLEDEHYFDNGQGSVTVRCHNCGQLTL